MNHNFYGISIYITIVILQDWMEFDWWVSLDTATCNRENRNRLIKLFKVCTCIPSSRMAVLSPACFPWILLKCSREVRLADFKVQFVNCKAITILCVESNYDAFKMCMKYARSLAS